MMESLEKISRFALQKSISTIVVLEAVEIKTLEGGNSIIYNAVKLQQQKTKVIANEKVIAGSIQKIIEWYNSLGGENIPVLFIINSSKVLHKIVHKNESEILEKCMSENFVGLNTNEFYSQIQSLPDSTKNALSITRKVFLDSIINQTDSLKSRIIYCHIGPFYAIRFYNVLFKPQNDLFSINIQNYSFELTKTEFINYRIGQYETTFFGEQSDINTDISPELLISYCYGTDFFINPESIPHIAHSGIAEQRGSFFWGVQSKLFSICFLGFLFILLLISSGIFSIYHKKYSALQEEHQEYLNNINVADRQKTEATKKTDFLIANGFLLTQKVTYVVDNITHSLSEGIFFNKVTVYPESKKKRDNGVEFDSTQISITGNCYSLESLEQWISRLKKIKWIKDVSIKEFKQIINSDLYEFNIHIVKHS